MKIEFFLQADLGVGKTLKIREYFRFVGGGQRVDVTGKLVPAINIDGHVDDDIRKQHPKDYAKFAALVEVHKDRAYALCRENPGHPVYAADFVPAPEPVADVEESDPPSDPEKTEVIQ